MFGLLPNGGVENQSAGTAQGKLHVSSDVDISNKLPEKNTHKISVQTCIFIFHILKRAFLSFSKK